MRRLLLLAIASLTVAGLPALADEPPDAVVRPSPAALGALCADAFAGIATQAEPPTPVAILAAEQGPLAHFVVDYLHWCLDDRGIALVERARLGLLLEELETQRMLGGDDITRRVAALAGGESLLAVAVHVVDPETRDITTRLSAVEGAAVLHATAPVRVENHDLVALQRELATRNNRLVAGGLSAVLPGAGQLYNDQPIKAGLALGFELALTGAALAFHLEGAREEDAYHGGREEDVHRGDLAEQAYGRRNLLLWAALGVWAVQVIDAIAYGGLPADVQTRYRERIGTGVGPGSAGLRVDF